MSIRPRLTYKHTMLACYGGYLTQALVINFTPLLFVTFMSDYGLSLSQTTALVTLSFLTQLAVDLLASRYVDRIGYRASAIAAHACAALGVLGLAVLPSLFEHPLIGLALATVLASIGGGIIEVVISPMVEACPTDGKRGSMSLLHSFYCWGQAGTVLLSTLFFRFFGIGHWRLLACLWAILPALGVLAFAFVPVYRLPVAPVERNGTRRRSPLRNRAFVMFFILMICAGAAEQAMSQWASAFAESALGLDKTLGDLLGPCAFAIMMGISRLLYGKYSDRISLERFMLASCSLCVIAYILAAFAPHPLLALVGCGLCGLSVGILWPGTYSRAAERLSGGGVTMFGLLAFGGDIGCLVGPAATGQIASMFGDDLRPAFLFALVFPIVSILLTVPAVFGQEKPSNRS